MHHSDDDTRRADAAEAAQRAYAAGKAQGKAHMNRDLAASLAGEEKDFDFPLVTPLDAMKQLIKLVSAVEGDTEATPELITEKLMCMDERQLKYHFYLCCGVQEGLKLLQMALASVVLIKQLNKPGQR